MSSGVNSWATGDLEANVCGRGGRGSGQPFQDSCQRAGEGGTHGAQGQVWKISVVPFHLVVGSGTRWLWEMSVTS